MIYCVCGIIGAGKTTYALDNIADDEEFIDFDKIKEDFNYSNNGIVKCVVLDLLEDAVKDDTIDTWFTCTLPNKDEQALLDKAHCVKYIWVHTDIVQSVKNITKRNRPNEAHNIDSIITKSECIQSKAEAFIEAYNAKIVSPYELTHERW